MARPKIQKWIGEAGEDNAELMGMSLKQLQPYALQLLTSPLYLH